MSKAGDDNENDEKYNHQQTTETLIIIKQYVGKKLISQYSRYG